MKVWMRKNVQEITDKTDAESDTDEASASLPHIIFRMHFCMYQLKKQKNNFDADTGVKFACDDDHVILQESIFTQYARSKILIIFGVT
jgi:hypothetical protein